MLKDLTAALFLLAAAPTFAADEVRDLSVFTEVVLAVPADVELVQASGHSVAISGSDEVIERLVTDVDDEVLTVHLEDRWFSWLDDEDLELVITLEDLTGLHIKGSGAVVAEELALDSAKISITGSGDIAIQTVGAEDLAITITGSGDIAIDQLDAEDVVTVLRGSGDVALGGRATSHEITIQGSGDVGASALNTDQVSVVVSGSGDAEVWAEAKLDAVVRGSGDVSYRGNAEVSRRVYGSGTVVEM